MIKSFCFSLKSFYSFFLDFEKLLRYFPESISWYQKKSILTYPNIQGI